MTTRIITVTADKGGVGKTTTASTIAVQLAARDAQVLLVDFDRQGQTAIATGNDPAPDVARHLIFGEPLRNLIHQDAQRPALHLWRGNSTTITAGAHAQSIGWNAHRFAEEIEMLPITYDYVVVDTPPVGYLQEIAIQAAHQVIIPVALDALSINGMAATIRQAAQLGQHNIIILPVMGDATNETKYNINLLSEKYGDMLAPGIPRRVAVREAQAEGRTITEYAPENDAAIGYALLVNRITADDSELLFSIEE